MTDEDRVLIAKTEYNAWCYLQDFVWTWVSERSAPQKVTPVDGLLALEVIERCQRIRLNDCTLML